MKKRKEEPSSAVPALPAEPGAPFELPGMNSAINTSGLRVIPSQFSFPEYPVSVALIREQAKENSKQSE